MIIFLIIIGIILCIVSISFLIFVVKDTPTAKEKLLAVIYYIAEPFAGSILFYLGLLLIIVGVFL